MARQYLSREGTPTAVDTKTALATLGSETAPGALNVPAGATQLLGVIVASAANFAGTGSSGIIFRLEGSGLPFGPETVVGGAFGCSVATGKVHASEARLIPLGVPVTPGNEILCFADATGADLGQYTVGITLVFDVPGAR